MTQVTPKKKKGCIRLCSNRESLFKTTCLNSYFVLERTFVLAFFPP